MILEIAFRHQRSLEAYAEYALGSTKETHSPELLVDIPMSYKEFPDIEFEDGGSHEHRKRVNLTCFDTAFQFMDHPGTNALGPAKRNEVCTKHLTGECWLGAMCCQQHNGTCVADPVMIFLPFGLKVGSEMNLTSGWRWNPMRILLEDFMENLVTTQILITDSIGAASTNGVKKT